MTDQYGVTDDYFDAVAVSDGPARRDAAGHDRGPAGA